MLFSPFFKPGIGPYSIPYDSLIIFYPHNLFTFGCLIFQLKNCPLSLICQDGRNTFGYFLKISIVSGNFPDMYHINLPECIIRILIPGMPFNTRLNSMQQIHALYLLH